MSTRWFSYVLVLVLCLFPATALADDAGGRDAVIRFPGNGPVPGALVTFGNYPGTWQFYANTTPFSTAFNVATPGAPPINVLLPNQTSLAPGYYPGIFLLVPSSVEPYTAPAVAASPPSGTPTLVSIVGLTGEWLFYDAGTIPFAVNTTTGQRVFVSPTVTTGLFLVATSPTTSLTTFIVPVVPSNPPIHINLWSPGQPLDGGNPGPAPTNPGAPVERTTHDPGDSPHQ